MRRRSRFLAVALTTPTLGSSLGIDGGGIFQIVAIESLELDPKAIGIAFGMGVLSVPVQLVAARTPLWRARRNLQIFLTFAAAQCWFLALLLALDVAGEGLALLALAVTVIAEISLSVLYAPAWQPLLSFALSTEDRQTVNTRGRAAGALVVVGMLILFGAAGDGQRALLLVLVGAAAVALAAAGRHLPAPDRPAPVTPAAAGDDGGVLPGRPGIPRPMRPIYATVGLGAMVATWPLFLIYNREVLWPEVNLGLLGAAQLVGSLLAAVLWRPTLADVTPRAVRASVALVIATLAVALIRVPVSGAVEGVATFGALMIAAASASTILIAQMERAHRELDGDTSVRALTVFDVIGSTSMQVGLLVAGLLVSASVTRTDWPLDPYRIFLLAGSVGVALALAAPRLHPAPP